MEITAVKPHKRKKNRCRVYIDGKFAFDIDGAAVEENNIQKGLKISAAAVENFKQRHKFSRALDYGRFLISYRKRSIKELSARLKKKGYSGSISQKVLNELEKCGEVDDMDFAASWIRSRRRSRPKGEFAIKNELREKGVANHIIEEALEKVNQDSPPDRVSLALMACEGMLENYRSLDKTKARRRLRSLLSRRGFDFDTIKEVEKISLMDNETGNF